MNKITLLLGVFALLFPVTRGMAEDLNWGDVYYSSGPYTGANKVTWTDRSEAQKVDYLELHYKAIQYCTQNIGKPPKELDLSKSGPYIVNFPKVTPEVISMYYRMYGDLRKAAELKYKYWVDSNHNPLLAYGDENPMDFVISGYEEAEMYKELADFYPQVIKANTEKLALFTDVQLLKSDFAAYKSKWPEAAAGHLKLMSKWKKAKQLAKTTKHKSLDPAVQNHEWFYSEKQSEVLKSLDYYHQHRVSFMLEKATGHKDPIVAAKAKEYINKPE